MRVLAGRTYWLPRHRLEGLKRIAFVGDSYVFGQGVDPDETLPARTQAHLNERAHGAPVEAVNLGVCGYNIWNVWESFKRVAQVYDGAVLVLCCNDAQLFGRSYNIDYTAQVSALWESDHAFRGALEACFDDIAAWTSAASVPVAVCYFNVQSGRPLGEQRWSARIAETIGAMCAARALPFVDLLAHLASRNIPSEQWVVGEADQHPSAMAHDAAARHLALKIREWGWTGALAPLEPDDCSGGIVACAAALMARESYPPDAALRWASAALESRQRAVLRAAAASGNSEESGGVENASETVAALFALWRRGALAAALDARALGVEDGIAAHVSLLDEAMLRLEEIFFVASRESSAALIDSLVPGSVAGPADSAQESRALIERAAVELAASREEIEKTRTALLQSFPAHAADLADFQAGLFGLERLAGLVMEKFDEALRVLDRVIALMQAVNPSIAARLEPFLAAETANAARGASSASRKLHLARPDALLPLFTTVQVSVAVNRIDIEGRFPCALEVQVNAAVPKRLPFLLRQNFLPDGARAVLSFRFPAFYAARIAIVARIPEALAGQVHAEISDIHIHNGPGQSRALPLGLFSKDAIGRLVSPDVFVV